MGLVLMGSEEIFLFVFLRFLFFFFFVQLFFLTPRGNDICVTLGMTVR